MLASEVGPLLLYASPPSPPPGSVAHAHLGEGPGPRISPEALEALRRHPVRPHQLLGRLEEGLPVEVGDVLRMSRSLEGTLKAKASLTALLLHLAAKRPGESLSREEAEEVAPGSSSLLGVLEAPPFLLLRRKGSGHELLRPVGEALREVLDYARALLSHVEKRVPQS